MAKLNVFKKSWLTNVKVIKAPMRKVALEVASRVTERNYVAPTEPGKSGKYIVTLRAIAADKFPQLKSLFAKREEVPIEETNGLFLSAAIWVNDENVQPDLPMRGEIIHANIDYITDRKGDSVLRVVGEIQLQKSTVAETLDLDTFLSEDDKAMDEAMTQSALAAIDADDVVH